MIVSKEIREMVEETMKNYEKKMTEEKFLEALWALSKLKRITNSLLIIKEE